MTIRWVGMALVGAALVLGLGTRWSRARRFEQWTNIPLPSCAEIVDFDVPVETVLGYWGEGFYYVHLKGSPECIAEFRRSAVTRACESFLKTEPCGVRWVEAADDHDLCRFVPELVEEAYRSAKGGRVQSLDQAGIALLASPETGEIWFYDRKS